MSCILAYTHFVLYLHSSLCIVHHDMSVLHNHFVKLSCVMYALCTCSVVFVLCVLHSIIVLGVSEVRKQLSLSLSPVCRAVTYVQNVTHLTSEVC